MFKNCLFQKQIAFLIEDPHLTITSDMASNLRQLHDKHVSCKETTKEYLLFCADVFSDGDTICVGLHHKQGKLQYIELFRTEDYYNESYDIDVSFADFNKKLRKRYGLPVYHVVCKTTDEYCGSQTRWRMRGMKIDHWLMERFGPEEHVHISLY